MKNAFTATVLMLVALGTSAQGATITLKQVKCINQQEPGFDEIEVVIRADGVERGRFARQMSNGDTLPINQAYTFTNSLTVRVIERDSGADDHFGTVTIDSSGAGEKALSGGQAAQYEYRVVWE